MTNKEPSPDLTFENLKNIEAELFKRKNNALALDESRKPEEAKTGRDTWRLN